MVSDPDISVVEIFDRIIRKWHPGLDGKRAYAGEISREFMRALADMPLSEGGLFHAAQAYGNTNCDLTYLRYAIRAYLQHLTEEK